MKKMICEVFVFGFILSACISSPINNTPAILTQVPLLPSSTQNVENINIQTPTLPVIQVSPTAISNEFKIVQQCISIANETPLQKVGQKGTVVLSNGRDDPIHLLDLQTGEQYSLPFLQTKHNLVSLSGLHVSPDGTKLAYVEDILNQNRDTTRENIWVVNAKGTVLASQTIDAIILSGKWRWMDNESMQFQLLKVTPQDGTVIIVNPFTKVSKYVSNQLPYYYQYFDIVSPSWSVDYNPNLEWVVYLGNIGASGQGPIVRDVVAGKTIWQAAGSFPTINVPDWSPTGDQVAVLVDGNLYRIKRSGQVTELPGPGDGGNIMGFSWSPDGRYFILLVRYELPTLKGYLMLYDVQANQVIDSCIEDDSLNNLNLPVWSADSRQFFFRTNQTGIPMLVDIQQKSAYKLPEQTEILGWMNSIP
jgi:WD40 repeat protein